MHYTKVRDLSRTAFAITGLAKLNDKQEFVESTQNHLICLMHKPQLYDT